MTHVDFLSVFGFKNRLYKSYIFQRQTGQTICSFFCEDRREILILCNVGELQRTVCNVQTGSWIEQYGTYYILRILFVNDGQDVSCRWFMNRMNDALWWRVSFYYYYFFFGGGGGEVMLKTQTASSAWNISIHSFAKEHLKGEFICITLQWWKQWET